MIPRSRRRWLLRLLMALLSIAAILFFADSLLDVRRQGALGWPTVASWPWVMLSLAVAITHMVVMGGVFAWLVGAHGLGRVLSIFLFSQAIKYVPGKVWGMAAQHALLGESSQLARVIGANISFASILLASQLALVIAATLYVRFGLRTAVVAGLLVCLLAGSTAGLLQRVHRAHGWRVLVPWSRIGVGLITGSGSFSALLLTGLAWAALFGGGLGYSAQVVASWTAVASASFVAGMLSILPGGLGIREAAFVAFGTYMPALDPGEAPMLALLTRAWLLAVDAVAVGMGLAGLLVMRARSLK